MVHNFWSFRWIIQRLKKKAKEYGIEVIWHRRETPNL